MTFLIIVGIIVGVALLWEKSTATPCSRCSKTVPRSALKQYGSELLCYQCHKKILCCPRCSGCGQERSKENLTVFMYGEYCDSCFQKRINEECDYIGYGKTRNEILTWADYKYHLQSQYWRTIREIALAKAKHKCSRCGATYGLQAHHLTYKNIGNERINDVQILCDRCHEREHKQNDENRDWYGHPLYKAQCKATTKKGIRCTRQAIRGSDFCSVHTKVNELETPDQVPSLETPKTHSLHEKILDTDKPSYTAEQVYSMIEQAAYFKGQADKFARNPAEYWAEAEREINEIVSKSR